MSRWLQRSVLSEHSSPICHPMKLANDSSTEEFQHFGIIPIVLMLFKCSGRGQRVRIGEIDVHNGESKVSGDSLLLHGYVSYINRQFHCLINRKIMW